MTHFSFVRLTLVFVYLAALLGTPAPIAAQPVAITPASPSVAVLAAGDTPTTLVGSGVNNFTVAASRVSWLSLPTCPATPPGVTIQATPQGAGDPVTISRIPTYGGAARQLFARNDPRAAGVCNPYSILSNIVADSDYVYWVDITGLVRLSVNANPGDQPELLNPNVAANHVELAISTDRIYGLSDGHVWGHDKTGPGTGFEIYYSSDPPSNLSFDGQYLYFLANGNLRRATPEGALATLVTGVTAYYAEGLRFCLIVSGCSFTNRVFFAKPFSSQLFIYDNRTNRVGSTPFYTSPEQNSSIFQITGDGTNIFTFEQRNYCDPPPPTGQNCFANRFSRTLYRIPISTRAGAAIYNVTVPSGITPPVINKLTTDGTFLFWDQTFALLNLPNDAVALPRIDMRVTGMEITQGIQNLNNTVRLIRGRRTFVRVYAQSTGVSVPGVTMHLFGSWANGGGGPLLPANSVGTAIRVYPDPNRNNINESFLFELPWDWIARGDLRLRAVLNPYNFPLQNSYAGNQFNGGPFSFQLSPRLEMQFVAFGYYINNQYYAPRLADDVVQTFSYIRRTYPLASTPGFRDDPSPGFRPGVWYVPDDDLGARVNRSHESCADNLCATAYTNSLLAAMRTEEQLPANVFLYGMVSDAAGWFPRGQENGTTGVSSGPVGIPGAVWANEPKNADGTSKVGLGSGWDTDTTYGDWYAAHEIGHSLGRPHPVSGSDDPGTTVDKKGVPILENCQHFARTKTSDPVPDYEHGDTTSARAPIGPSDNSIEGFDGGDAEFRIKPAVFPSATWNDFMSYCSNQWISDYTYNFIYDKLMAPRATVQSVQRVQVDGDWLSVFGSIAADSSRATIDHLRRRASVMEIPPRTPGDYSIRLLGVNGAQLADYPFTPNTDADALTLGYGQVVPFVAGTRSVQIVRLSDNAVLTSHAMSATAPTISGVALLDAPNPTDGTAMLGWTASDADGDALTFDIFYSRDGGVTFQPVKLGASGASTKIDTARLGGSGSAILRVVASDGGQSAQADSAPFTMTVKAPQPRISSPENGVHLHWGQLINLSGEAEDFQDGSVTGANLVWSTQRGSLGTGALLTVNQLAAGANVITLTATNSAGIAASTSITVFVDDDLQLPGPILSAAPAQIGWSVGDGETAVQTAQIAISNTGGDTLNWTATSDAAWLTLDAASGSAPATLTLSADPTQISGPSARATVTITVAASGTEPAQTLAIPVSVTKGNAFTGPLIIAAPIPPSRLYLPLVQQ